MLDKFNHSGEKGTIAINTVIIYIRLAVTTLVGIFTSRFVLQLLGISDYGLYNVVGGVIALFSVVSASLSVTTMRFLNFELGKPDGNPNETFNVCNVIHIVFALILLILAETVGIIYILYYLNVETGKEGDAMFVFQVSTIVACLGIINVPYSSIFSAKEKFLFTSIVDIVNSFVKLALILSLFLYTGNVLRMYAALMSATTFISFFVYHYFSYRYWPEIIKWSFVKDKQPYRHVLSFTNYNILSTVAMLARSQGSNILINWFFGTIVNGAFAIARTVQSFVEAFTVNFDVAAAPKITQHISAGEHNESQNIVSLVCRFCILMMTLVFFPLMCETELVLSIWLGQVPEYSTLFCRILLIVVMVASTSGGIVQFINGSGKIKWFKLQSCFWYVIILPIAYAMFKYGFGPEWMLILFIFSDIFNRICQLILMKRLLNFDSMQFIKESYLRPTCVIIIMSLIMFLYWQIDIQSDLIRFCGILFFLITTAAIVWLIGLRKSEKSKILSLVHK